ncbi:MAG: hypothetical protein OJF59_002842 [Cytophagales bacterium]|jgi:hypothetical protein|nr:MAG: hypothetical protein OJF59_002842 [Cytophagales bacterium]
MIKAAYHFETSAQIDTLLAFDFAVRNRKLVFVTDKHGSGFHFSLKKFNTLPCNSDLRVTQFQFNNSLKHDAAISMFRDLGCTIQVVNKNYKKMNLHDFLVALSNRAKLDLRGRRVLIVFDRFEKLRSEYSLSEFFSYLKLLQLPCGIIVRTTERHIKLIKEKYESIYAYICQFNRKKIREITRDDVIAFCDAFGLSNKLLREQIAGQTTNLHIVKKYIIDAGRLPETTQMTLFG